MVDQFFNGSYFQFESPGDNGRVRQGHGQAVFADPQGVDPPAQEQALHRAGGAAVQEVLEVTVTEAVPPSAVNLTLAGDTLRVSVPLYFSNVSLSPLESATVTTPSASTGRAAKTGTPSPALSVRSSAVQLPP